MRRQENPGIELWEIYSSFQVAGTDEDNGYEKRKYGKAVVEFEVAITKVALNSKERKSLLDTRHVFKI